MIDGFNLTEELVSFEKGFNNWEDAIRASSKGLLKQGFVEESYVDSVEKEKLIEDVMLDAISLSQCEEILITSSNVSAYTLAINPFIKYIFLDQQ